jgi:hypothetical protein
MWENDQHPPVVLSHDMLCLYCGHALHVYLTCGDDCECGPHEMPGYAGPKPVPGLAA